MTETVTITKEEYESLLADKERLDLLKSELVEIVYLDCGTLCLRSTVNEVEAFPALNVRRGIDELKKKIEIMTETVTITITKEEYEMLLANTKRMNFLERYRPSMTVDTHGIIDTLRYGSVTECIDGAINDMRELQTVFWVGEETEIYAARSLEELVLEKWFTEVEMDEYKREGAWGVVTDLDKEINVLNEETGLKEKTTLKQLLEDCVSFPTLLLTSYN
ncbi:hypothetical protein NM952_12225 [Pasteurella multocida subsp. multocida]|uniref:hypothetical protein n=1 Tax=Pasteurella multocida TaxID=747 RepID=UPI002301F40A|nr:hypothetical protein [Pasteurella multocida]MDA5619352.1 hypothetical protein [Pasteurella multocida subsp. multocida]